MNLPCCLLALVLLASACKKDKNDPNGLPPATQEGRHSFGCLVNGEAWTPNGNNGTSNFRLTYDLATAGGDLIIRCYRYSSESKRQYLLLSGVPITGVGSYNISERGGPCGVSYTDENRLGTCKEYRYTNVGYRSSGALKITRLDLQAGIIAGTFEAKLVQTGCDTLRITQGRFDYKL